MVKPKTGKIVFLLLVPIMAGCDGAGVSSYGKATGNVYENKLLGLTISKPDSWGMITAKKDKKKISSAKGEGRIEKLITALDSRPIVSMFKSRKEPF